MPDTPSEPRDVREAAAHHWDWMRRLIIPSQHLNTFPYTATVGGVTVTQESPTKGRIETEKVVHTLVQYVDLDSPDPVSTTPQHAQAAPVTAVNIARLMEHARKTAANIGPFKSPTYPQTVVQGDWEYTQTGPDTATVRNLRPVECIVLDFILMDDGTCTFDTPAPKV